VVDSAGLEAEAAVGAIHSATDAKLSDSHHSHIDWTDPLGPHPGGRAPRIANLPERRAHILARLRREAAASADPALAGGVVPV
jgi:hypothetical protein